MCIKEAIQLSDEERHEYVSGKFFRCVSPFLSWMKKNDAYWFEYKGSGVYEVRSDNALWRNFCMTDAQLLRNFVPVSCEASLLNTCRHFFWLGQFKDCVNYVDDIANTIIENKDESF